MLQSPVSRFLQVYVFIVVVMLMGSCASSKKAREELRYLNGNIDIPENLKVALNEVTIQKGDLLGIFIYSDNPEATAIFNQQVVSSAGSGSGDAGVAGYLVDQHGNIRFQTLGELHVEGLTKLQLSDSLNKKLKIYLSNPYADIRFLNFHVNIIGEVNKPGPYSIPEEKLTILELISLAGDLTMFGRRDNLLVIREKEGKREFGRVNLKDPNVFQSPYFNLQQNDVVMVDANSRKQTGTEQQVARSLTIVSAIVSIISVSAIVYNILSR